MFPFGRGSKTVIGAYFSHFAIVFGLGLIMTIGASADELSLKCTPLFTGAVFKDPVIEIDVSVSGVNWHVVHITQSGAQYWRERQYMLRDNSSGGARTWDGTLISHPNLSMVGGIHVENGKIEYNEIIYDAKRGGAIAGMVRSVCAVNSAIASIGAPSSQANPALQANPAATDSTSQPAIAVPMELNGGTFTVPVQINGAITLKFMIDSGA